MQLTITYVNVELNKSKIQSGDTGTWLKHIRSQGL